MPVTVTEEDRWATDWWCPEDQRFVDCPGPCTDGRLHVKRSRWKKTNVIRADSRQEALEFHRSISTPEKAREVFGSLGHG